jgi:Membrane protein putatively involved in post-translational modification of the autoinducing quorum-sensing peptide
MIKRLAERIVDWQTKKHFLSEGERGLYEYAYEVMVNQVLNILIAVMIAILFRAPMPVLVFLISYIPLRSYCGGHHASTNEGCMVVSAVLICIICILYRAIPRNIDIIIQPMAYIISGLLIIRYAPVGDANKPLVEKEVARYRKIGRCVWFVESLIGMFLFFMQSRVGVVLALSHIVFCVMFYWGILVNRN